MHKPSQDHQKFDAICAEVGEWDTLPTVATPHAEREQPAASGEDDRDTELDGLIFAGLVTPY